MKIATLTLIVRDGHVLLGEKLKDSEIGKGVLVAPGGKLKEGETLEACRDREVLEEWGIRLIGERPKVARIVFFARGKPDFEVHVYVAREFEGELTENAETRMPEWFPVNSLPLERMFEGDGHWFSKAASGDRFVANVYYREQAKGFEGIDFFDPDF